MGKISFEDFINELKGYQIILLGEIHGTKEIPDLIKEIIMRLKKEIVLLEIPENYTNAIERFCKENKDGRGSKEILELIQYLKERKIVVKFIESDQEANKDKGMFKNTIKHLKGKSIILCGNIHSSYVPLPLFKNPTFAGYMKENLQDKLVNVNLLPLSGEYNNFGIKTIIKKSLKEGIYKNLEDEYDYTFLIKKVTPCS